MQLIAQGRALHASHASFTCKLHAHASSIATRQGAAFHCQTSTGARTTWCDTWNDRWGLGVCAARLLGPVGMAVPTVCVSMLLLAAGSEPVEMSTGGSWCPQ